MCNFEKDCRTALQNYLQDDDFKILRIDDIGISFANGIMGSHFRNKVTYQFKERTDEKIFFLKTMVSPYDVQTEMIKIQGAYTKEAFIYEIFFKELGKIPGYNLDFVAKCYLTKKDELFILEDLQSLSYVGVKSVFTRLDYNHFIFALDVIARFHAGSFIYEETQSRIRNKMINVGEEFSQYLKEPLYREDKNYPGHILLKSGEKVLLALLDVAPQFSSTCEEMKMKLSKAVDQVFQIVKPSGKFRNVICHGDLWMTNLLFKYIEDKPKYCKLIDFQALRYTIPAHDVIFLIFSTSNLDFIQKHQSELYSHYYECLKKCLNKCNIDVNKYLTFREFLETVEYILPFVVVQSLMWVTFCAGSLEEKIKEDQELFKEFWYGDKREICVKHYRENTTFRKMIDEAFLYLQFLK